VKEILQFPPLDSGPPFEHDSMIGHTFLTRYMIFPRLTTGRVEEVVLQYSRHGDGSNPLTDAWRALSLYLIPTGAGERPSLFASFPEVPSPPIAPLAKIPPFGLFPTFTLFPQLWSIPISTLRDFFFHALTHSFFSVSASSPGRRRQVTGYQLPFFPFPLTS